MKAIILGAGAVGGILGGLLAERGQDVTLIDTFEDHVRAIGEDGLRIDGFLGDHLVKNVKAFTPKNIEGSFDIVFIAVKSIDTDEALRSVAPYVHKDTFYVSLQNGINEDHIADMVGKERVMGGVTQFAATFNSPGHLSKTSAKGFVIGELDGAMTERLKKTSEILELAMPEEIVVTDNIWGHLWTKILINSCTNGMGAITGMLFGEYVPFEGVMEAFLCLWSEAYDVAKGTGIELEMVENVLAPETFVPRDDEEKKENAKGLMLALAKSDQFGKMKSSMLQDIERGRLTEIDFLNGYIVKKGRDAGFETPAHKAMVSIVREIERGERSPGSGNVRELLRRIQQEKNMKLF